MNQEPWLTRRELAARLIVVGAWCAAAVTVILLGAVLPRKK